MRLSVAFDVALALGLLSSTTTAFVSCNNNNRRRAILSPRRVSTGQGWDNEDFLGALSGDASQMDEANEAYQRKSRYAQEGQYRYEDGQDRPNVVEPPSSSSHGDDAPLENHDQGGSRFKELLNRAQESGGGGGMGGLEPPMYTPPPDLQQQQQLNMDNLSVEEQARLFREFMAQNQGQSAPVQQQQSKQMPGGVDAQGRRIGRNKDADSIANSADLYFAQLKRDSAVRTKARYQGDVQKANQAMTDASIKDLEEQLRKNPYLTAQQERARSFVQGTSEDEMLVVVPEQSKTDKPRDYTGVNFRKKMQEVKSKKKKKKQQQQASVPPEPAVEPPAVTVQAPEPAAVQPPPAVEKPPQQNVVTAREEPPTTVIAREPDVVREQPPPRPQQTTSRASTPAEGGETNEETRRQIRTLMGLMLKHRGGPGFGKGRLKGTEAERFQNLLEEITAMLRSEAGMAPTEKPTMEEQELEALEERVAAMERMEKQKQEQQPIAKQKQQQPIAKQKEPQQQPIAADRIKPSPEVDKDVMDGTVACVEGAIAAYRNAAPQDKEGILLSLRAALMSAVNTCNMVIAENELANKEAYEAARAEAAQQTNEPDVPTTTMAFPDEFQDTQPAAPVASNADADDPNTQLLTSIYDKLKSASGNAQFGLKSGLSPDEANELADQLVEMRNVLMDELDNGIPAPMATSEPTTEVPQGGSKYQQMLAKAKGRKGN